MSTPAVGSDIAAMCTKCGDVFHVIVAMVGAKIAKVQCKQCGGLHRYKPSLIDNPALAVVAPKPVRKKRASKATGAGGLVAPKGSPVIDPNKPTTEYSPSSSFTVGEQVQHVRFGTGIVQHIEIGKMSVWFEEGLKILSLAKPASDMGPRPAPAFEQTKISDETDRKV